MLKSYLMVGIRNLYKNRLYAVINILGLGVAIGVCITGYVNYQYCMSFDSYLQNSENIHLVGTYRTIDHNRQRHSQVPTPLAPVIKTNLPGIKHFTRLLRASGILRFQDKVFNESVYYLDKNFFDIFTFPMLKGSKDALHDKNSLIITDEIASKYFGDEDPIGKQIVFSPDGQADYTFLIGGVMAKPPTNSSMLLTVCLPYERRTDILGSDIEAWDNWTSAAFIQTDTYASVEQIEANLDDFVPQVNKANLNYQASGFFLINLLDLSSSSTMDLTNRPFNSQFHFSQIIVPSVIALLVLLLACFNFVNTAVAFASRRLNEIAIRKVIGSQRRQLILQFLGENILLCMIAFALGLFLAEPFTLFYDSLIPNNTFTLTYFENPGLIAFLAILLSFTAFAAGYYPALYISRFNPVTIFSGQQRLGGTNRLIRILLSLQFAISIIAILSSIMMYRNSQYIENFDPGFDKEQVIVIPVRGENNFQLLNNAIKNNPDILSIGASEHTISHAYYRGDIEIEQNISRIRVMNIGENYFETVGMKLVNGKLFDYHRHAESEQSILITEKTVQSFGLTSPIGKYSKFISGQSSKEYKIIGVVKDLYLEGLWQEVEPIVLRYAPLEKTRFLSFKFNLNNVSAVSEYVRNKWHNIFPHLPYEGFYQGEVLGESATITDAIRRVFLYIAVIVVLASAMGLFALVSLNIVKKTKEFGIRKVLGANIFNIGYLVSREFIFVFLAASVMGSLLGYWLINTLMTSIWAYHVDFGLIPVMLASMLMVFVALFAVGSQIVSVARANPIDSIRYE